MIGHKPSGACCSWDSSPRARPTFDEIITELETLREQLGLDTSPFDAHPTSSRSGSLGQGAKPAIRISQPHAGAAASPVPGASAMWAGGRNSDPNLWTEADVVAWVEEKGMSWAAEIMAKNDVNGKVLLTLTDDDLKELGVQSFGWRRSLRVCFAAHTCVAELLSCNGRCAATQVEIQELIDSAGRGSSTPTSAKEKPKIDLTGVDAFENGHAFSYCTPGDNVHCSFCELAFEKFERGWQCKCTCYDSHGRPGRRLYLCIRKHFCMVILLTDVPAICSMQCHGPQRVRGDGALYVARRTPERHGAWWLAFEHGHWGVSTRPVCYNGRCNTLHCTGFGS